jgi:hemerythrin
MEKLIIWNKALELGLTIVDEEHKILIQLINDLNEVQDVVDSEQKDIRLKIALQGLAEYTQTHFVVEEEFMRIYNYPDRDQHRRIHQAFIERISLLMDSLESGGLDIPTSLMHFLKNWLSSHILEVDKKLVDFLISKGVH